MLWKCSWLSQIQPKRNCPNLIICVWDTTNSVVQGTMSIYLPSGSRELILFGFLWVYRTQISCALKNVKICLIVWSLTSNLAPARMFPPFWLITFIDIFLQHFFSPRIERTFIVLYRVSHNIGSTLFFVLFSGSGAHTEELLTFFQQPWKFGTW